MNRAYGFARYFAAFLILFYGFAKLNEAQFTVIDSELDKPMKEVSGFWLTWYYFGYSKVYGNLIAILQILSGIGLLFKRTTLISALALLAIMSNILLIDFFFGIPMQGFAMAILITILVLLIIAPHIKPLINLFWNKQPRDISTPKMAGAYSYHNYPHCGHLLCCQFQQQAPHPA